MTAAKFYLDPEKKTVLFDMSGQDNIDPQGLILLKPNTVDAAVEKHIPIISYVEGEMIVRVGETPHPMIPEHYIEWIFVRTLTGGMFRKLRPGDAPEVRFDAKEEEVIGVFAYCNIHGLWEADTESYRFDQTACSMEFPHGCIDKGLNAK